MLPSVVYDPPRLHAWNLGWTITWPVKNFHTELLLYFYPTFFVLYYQKIAFYCEQMRCNNPDFVMEMWMSRSSALSSDSYKKAQACPSVCRAVFITIWRWMTAYESPYFYSRIHVETTEKRINKYVFRLIGRLIYWGRLENLLQRVYNCLLIFEFRIVNENS